MVAGVHSCTPIHPSHFSFLSFFVILFSWLSVAAHQHALLKRFFTIAHGVYARLLMLIESQLLHAAILCLEQKGRECQKYHMYWYLPSIFERCLTLGNRFSNVECLYFHTIPGVVSVMCRFFCLFPQLFHHRLQFTRAILFIWVCVCIGIRLMTMKCARRSMCTSICDDKMSIKQVILHSYSKLFRHT